jgi:hypothetical protein
LFFCQNWNALKEDLADLSEEVVSVGLVADPYGNYTQEQLADCFDVVNAYKVHYIADLTKPLDTLGSKHHRKIAQSALEKMEVKVCEHTERFAKGWTKLYQNLSHRHQIKGIRAFSEQAFTRQLQMPEIIVHKAMYKGEVIGAQLFFQHNDVVHCHLGAVNDLGYSLGAFYALDYYSIEYFSGKANKLDIGGGTGIFRDEKKDGLSRYKKGWSTEIRPVYFCGSITSPERYSALALVNNINKTSYFPAYRLGEFA